MHSVKGHHESTTLEIAHHARVSTATVSRALNRVPNVDPQLDERVWKTVHELGYYPNTQARFLVSGRSRVLGLIVSEMVNPFFPEVVQSFEDIAVQHDYEILLSSTVHDPKRWELAVRRMIERRVEGVALLTFAEEDSLTEKLHSRKISLVSLDDAPSARSGRKIQVDYQNGIREAVQHLAALGHVRIAFVAGPSHLKSSQERKAAFERSMKEVGLEISSDLMVVGDHSLEGGIRALPPLMSLVDPATAVMCSNDMTAIGVMRQAYDSGIEVPRELSIVGFDGIRLTQFMTPPLTTVQIPQVELAKLAFTALREQIEFEHKDDSEYVIPTQLVVRRSTATVLKSEHKRQLKSS